MEGERASATGSGVVQVVCRRMVRPWTPPPPMAKAENGFHPRSTKEEDAEVIHLTPWDLRLIGTDYLQKGILLPRPPAGGDALVGALESSLARALRLFYLFAGRLVVATDDDGMVAVVLRCTGEGAELVHAVAPGVGVADVVSSLYTPPVVRELFPLALARSAAGSVPVLAAQVTELADGVFVAVALNHVVGDGAALWHFFNTWSEISRSRDAGVGASDAHGLSMPPPVLQRRFLETCPVPIPMPLGKQQLEHIARRPRVHLAAAAVQECFLTFSGASVEKLKVRANDEVTLAVAGEATATATISSLEAVLAHLWRAVCRARRLPPSHATFYTVVVGCQGRVDGMPRGYVGNSAAFGRAEATADEVEENGLGWMARQLSRAVAASLDEERVTESLERWVRDPGLTRMSDLSSAGAGAAAAAAAAAAQVTGVSPWLEDVFGNDFGWGKPVAVRSGPGNKADGKAAVFQGPPEQDGGGGSLSLEVCLAPDALARLIEDEEFMEAVMPLPPRPSL